MTEKYEKWLNGARACILLVVILTAINFCLTYFEVDIFIYFSAMTPVVCFYMGPLEAVIGIAMFIGLILCYIMAKDRRVFVLVALILLIIDFFFTLYLIIYIEITDLVPSLMFHAWIMFYLVSGVIAWAKLRGVNLDEIKRKAAAFGRDEYGARTKASMAKYPYPEKFTVKVVAIGPILSLMFIGMGAFTYSVILIPMLIAGNGFEFDDNNSFGMLLGTIFAVIGVFLTIILLRWRMVVERGVIEYTPCFGKRRKIRLADVHHIRVAKTDPGFVAYSQRNQRLFSVNIYNSGYSTLSKAISPHITNSWQIPMPEFDFGLKRNARAKKNEEYLRGSRADDIIWYINDYSEDLIDKTELVSCKNCRLDNFSVTIGDAEGTIEVECTYCKEKRFLIDGKEYPADYCETVKVKCPECNSTEFNVGVGFGHRNDNDMKWAYIGARCTNCGLLGCPVDCGVNDSPPDEL